MQHHPHSSDVSKVADVFERLARKYPDGVVDMVMNSIVKYGADEHYCVTGVAGWFLLGTLDDLETDIMWESKSWAWPHDSDDPDVSGYAHWSTGKTIEFEDGAIRLSKMIEFRDFREVADFYESRPWVWGNHAGACLFSDVRAYGGPRGDTLTLDRIAKHWRGVVDRTRQIEAEMRRSERSFDEVEDWYYRLMEVA